MVSEDTLSLALIVGYMILTLGIGIYVYRYSEDTTTDYFLWDRKIGWILLPLTMVASVQSTFALLGAAGIYYSSGIGFIAIAISQVWVSLMILFFGWRLWALGKKYDYLTLHQFFEHRFDSKAVKYVTAFISFWMVFVYMSLQFVGAGHAIAGVAGTAISYEGALILTVVLTGVYTSIGGMRGVVYTDALQVVVLILSVIAIGVIVTGVVGPIDSLVSLFVRSQQVKPSLLSLPGPDDAYTPINWMKQFIVLPFGIFLMPHVWARILSAGDERSLASSAISIPISQLLIFVTSVLFTGLAGWIIYGQINAPDTLVPRLLADYTPWWLAALLMAGVIGAGRSTIDSMMLSLSQILSIDYITDFYDMTEAEQTWVSRGLTLVMMGLALAVAWQPPALFVNVIINIAFTGIAMLAPTFIAALYWKRANKWGALAGVSAGFLLTFLGTLLGISYPVLPNEVFAFIVNVIVLIGMSYLTPAPPEVAVEETIGFLDGLNQTSVEDGSGTSMPTDD